MKRQQFNLRIDELTIDGINSINSKEIQDAISQELSKWFGRKDLAISSSLSSRIAHMQSEVPIAEMATAKGISQQVKHTLNNGLKLEDKSYER